MFIQDSNLSYLNIYARTQTVGRVPKILPRISFNFMHRNRKSLRH